MKTKKKGFKNIKTCLNRVESTQFRRQFQLPRLPCVLKLKLKVIENDKTRLQTYTGTCFKVHKAGLKTSLTLKKISMGVEVRRVFPLHSPDIASIEKVPPK